MALDITINIEGDRETTLLRLVAEHNKRISETLAPETLTPAQYVRNHVRNEWLDIETRRYQDAQKVNMREAYRLATPQEQAQIDAILAQYR
jgi:hypothetical protein